MKIEGKIWKFGDNVDTDVMAPGKYLFLDMNELKKHTLEVLDPSFASGVQPGDLVLGGRNFGCGSSREQAPRVLKALGVGGVLAESFARIFYRNCVAIGLPVLAVPGLAEHSLAGDVVRADLATGEATNLRTQTQFAARPLPERMLAVLAEGGVVAALKRLA